MDFRLFIDEAGNGDLKGAASDPNVRYLGLTGVLTRQATHSLRIQPEMDDLKTELFGHSPATPVVLHRRELVRREGVFAVLRDPDTTALFNRRMMELFTAWPYLVITVLIDKKAHLEAYEVWHYDPYHYCMLCMIERYVMHLRAHKWRGDVMVEARFKSADKKLKASFARIYKEGTDNIRPQHVRDALLSGDLQMKPKSANVAGLQMADLFAHPSARHMRFERDKVPQPSDFGTRLADLLIAKKYRRHPQRLTIDGFGRKWLP